MCTFDPSEIRLYFRFALKITFRRERRNEIAVAVRENVNEPLKLDLISGYFDPISTNHFFGLNRKNVPANIGFIVTPRIFYDGFRSPIKNFLQESPN